MTFDLWLAVLTGGGLILAAGLMAAYGVAGLVFGKDRGGES